MRIVVMATGAFAGPMLQGLLRSRHAIVALATRPDRRAIRKPTAHSPLIEIAQAAALPLWQPDDVNAPEAIAHLRSLQVDLLVVCDFGQILSDECLRTARRGGINLHGSLLPRYRGAAPVQWAVYQGEPITGISVIWMNAGLDAGPILKQVELPIEPGETAESLERRLAELGAPAVEEAIEQLDQWDGRSALGTPQDPSQATRAPRIKKEQGLINWRRSAREIANQVRAFQPWPGSFSHWQRRDGQSLRIILHRATPEDGAETSELPGTVLEAAGERLEIQCGSGRLRVLQLQPAGKRILDAAEFLRGYPMRTGDRLQ